MGAESTWQNSDNEIVRGTYHDALMAGAVSIGTHHNTSVSAQCAVAPFTNMV